MTEFLARVTPSPVGDIVIVAGDEGIVTLHPFEGPLAFELERVSLLLRAPVVPDDGIGDDAVGQLDEYFEGERTGFELDLDWRLVSGFTLDALHAIERIPYGETASYGEVAVLAGRPGAARAAGTACRLTPFSVVVPVHRVIRADGSIGEYGGRPEVKRHLLELERGAGV
ncbi:methylated-DNA--[protein]-cysteine S-methyltransferase [Microbacterium sp. CJ88]|uniref:methylated-DNA--[protein]-cysteine S-methyltransferase n=1 Tax=Microbacterium sp. CJ88 TaxID=3445672 RepID=UPI003F6576F3